MLRVPANAVRVLFRAGKKATIIVNVNKVIGEINPWIFGSNAMLAKIIHKASEPRLAEVRSKNVDAWQAERGLSVVGERPRQITRLR